MSILKMQLIILGILKLKYIEQLCKSLFGKFWIRSFMSLINFIHCFSLSKLAFYS